MANKIFQNLKTAVKGSGGIKSTYKASLRIGDDGEIYFFNKSNPSRFKYDYNPELHILEYKHHLSIIKHLLSKKSKVANFEMFFMKDRKEDSTLKKHAKQWYIYIDLIRKNYNGTIDDQLINNIDDQIKDSTSFVSQYSLSYIGNKNQFEFRNDCKNKKTDFTNFILNNNFLSISVDKKSLFASKKDENQEYQFEDFDVNSRFSQFSDIVKITTLISLNLGHIFKSHDNKDFSKDKDVTNMMSYIKNKGLSSVINKLAEKYKIDYIASNADLNKISISEIIQYYKNKDNLNKINFDIFIGYKHNFNFQESINNLGFSVDIDKDELKIIESLNKEKIKTLEIKDLNKNDIKNLYSIYGEKYLYINSVNYLEKIDMLIYKLLINNKSYANYNSEGKSRPKNDIIDKILSDINIHFGRLKDYSFDGKKNFYKSFDGSLMTLLEYRNKTLSDKDLSIDYKLLDVNVSSEALKDRLFNYLFVY